MTGLLVKVTSKSLVLLFCSVLLVGVNCEKIYSEHSSREQKENHDLGVSSKEYSGSANSTLATNKTTESSEEGAWSFRKGKEFFDRKPAKENEVPSTEDKLSKERFKSSRERELRASEVILSRERDLSEFRERENKYSKENDFRLSDKGNFKQSHERGYGLLPHESKEREFRLLEKGKFGSPQENEFRSSEERQFTGSSRERELLRSSEERELLRSSEERELRRSSPETDSGWDHNREFSSSREKEFRTFQNNMMRQEGQDATENPVGREEQEPWDLEEAGTLPQFRVASKKLRNRWKHLFSTASKAILDAPSYMITRYHKSFGGFLGLNPPKKKKKEHKSSSHKKTHRHNHKEDESEEK